MKLEHPCYQNVLLGGLYEVYQGFVAHECCVCKYARGVDKLLCWLGLMCNSHHIRWLSLP